MMTAFSPPGGTVRTDAMLSARAVSNSGQPSRVTVHEAELSAGALDAARQHLAEALDILRALNVRPGIVYLTFNLGLAEYLRGSPGAAAGLFAESLGLARRAGMRSQVA